jgi:hypothetical protein
VFRSRSKPRQSTNAEQSAQSTFIIIIIIMAATKLEGESKSKVKVSSLSAHQPAGPLF